MEASLWNHTKDFISRHYGKIGTMVVACYFFYVYQRRRKIIPPINLSHSTTKPPLSSPTPTIHHREVPAQSQSTGGTVVQDQVYFCS